MWGNTSLWVCFAFPWWLVIWASYRVCWLSVCLLWKISNEILHPLLIKFLSMLLSCRSSLHILYISLLPYIWFANIIFPHSEGCLFILLLIFFAIESFLVWVVPIIYFYFILLHVATEFSQHHFWRDYYFLIVYIWLLTHKLVD